ncbi:FliH/SctL family protein [Undibacter mobilis]|uniref:Flagellar assembly protein FliH n=1 Tax=Undibacter mobilis TaxID=2292256 RepID=A0A371B6I8_9BRAD|nr:FliH/SctL family protein [Undibacter mobilis]RDV03190.1 flagellar assembly protein H [Undibacter mobilis]
MAAAAKFLFDEDFASGEKPTITLVEAERRREDAESIAHRKGFDAGQTQARAEQNERIARALTMLAEQAMLLDGQLKDIEARLESEAVQVAFAVASKLAPELIAREPFAEIEVLATDCFRQLIATPQISIHVGQDIYDEAKQKIEDIARSRGFDGRIDVMADAALAPGNCRIEWAEGGIVRDRDATLKVIDEAVQRYIAARTAPHN